MGLEFNPDKLRKIFSEMSNAMEMLRDMAALSSEEFSSDPHKVASAKYHFIVAIEGQIDLCNHIISKNRFRAPEDYADTFQILADQGVFNKDFTFTLKQMARFRNRFVHLYWEVDIGELYNILTTRLPDVEKFIEVFSSYIDAESGREIPDT
ncbi:MAG: DUF86 domain-containing protein [Deltaproteobacteria bacterium]|nr:DUF86 domain-containing protein [Deltaproteobacteria bacterium]